MSLLDNTLRSPPVDRLSLLPPELLSLVFEQVRLVGGHKNKGKPISKALLPYTTSNLYYRVYFDSLDKLKLFVRTILPEEGSTPTRHGLNLASLVKDFAVGLVEYEKLDPGWSALDSKKLFGALENLVDLSVAYCPPLMAALTSNGCGALRLDSLKSLSFDGCVAWEDNPFMMGRFRCLSAYQQLESLEISYLNLSHQVATDLPPLSSLPHGFMLPLTTLKLQLDGPEVSSASIATFLSYFNNLRTLSIHNYILDLDFDVALAGVHRDLESLTIVHGGESNDPPPPPFGEVLSRFQSLQDLNLRDIFFDNATLLHVKRCGLLKTIHLVCYGPHGNALSSLSSLLHRNVRPPNLTNLTIDVSRGQQGQDISNLEEVPQEMSEYRWIVADFDYDRAVALVRAASRIGIRVTGRLMEAIQIQAKWNDGVLIIQSRNEARRIAVQKVEEDTDAVLRELGEVA